MYDIFMLLVVIALFLTPRITQGYLDKSKDL